MIFVRNPQPVDPDEAGDLYRFALSQTSFLFRPMERNIVFREWLSKAADAPRARAEFLPWLERPFKECPFNHPHYNHGNAEEAGYYLVVESCPRGSDHPETYVTGLFIPAGFPAIGAIEHMRRTTGLPVDIVGVEIPIRQPEQPEVVVPIAA